MKLTIKGNFTMKQLCSFAFILLLVACSSEAEVHDTFFENTKTQIVVQTTEEKVAEHTSTVAPSLTSTIKPRSSATPTLEPTLTFIPSITPIDAPSFYVSENGSDSNDGTTESTSLRTINTAIQYANEGDVIYVFSGDYQENILIDKPILLIGDNAETTAIIGTGQGDVVRIMSNEVVFSGFTVKNSGQEYSGPFSGGDAGIQVYQASNVHISNTIVTENGLGISLTSSEMNTVENNLSFNNQYEGIYLLHSDKNIIQYNASNSNGGHGGYYIVGSSENIIVENTCELNPDHGMKLQEKSNNNIVEGNNCSGSNSSGIYLSDVYNNLISNNEFSNTNTGIYIRLSDKNKIEGNYTHHSEHGIKLDIASFNNEIRNNIVTNNDTGIGIYFSSNENTFTENEIVLNKTNGIFINRSSDNVIMKNLIAETEHGINILCGDVMHIAPDIEDVTWDEFVNSEKYFEKFKDIVLEKGIVFKGKDSADNKIFENIFDDIEKKGILSWDNEFDVCQTEIYAINNWWGAPTGPFHPQLNPKGKGVENSDGVVFDPWLTTRPENLK